MKMEGKIYASHQIDGTTVVGTGCNALIPVQADAQADVVDVVNTITNLFTNSFSSFSFPFSFLKV